MAEHGDRPADGITVRLRGGLGNQLFQYAAGSAVAYRLDCPLFVETAEFAAVLPGDTPRTFELEWLIDRAHVLVGSTPGVSRRILRRAVRQVSLPLGPRRFSEASFAFDPRIEDVKVGTTLEGYFQSWRYFTSVEDSLRIRLRSAVPRSPWGAQMEKELASRGPWIAVHVRRGDYLKPRNSSYHGLLGASYYETALSKLSLRGCDFRVVAFSDDPDAALELFGAQASSVETVRPPAESNPAESMLLMSQAGAIVTANSSFSWWAGWLADPAASTVVCPVPWFSQAGADESDLRPPTWVAIDADFTSD